MQAYKPTRPGKRLRNIRLAKCTRERNHAHILKHNIQDARLRTTAEAHAHRTYMEHFITPARIGAESPTIPARPGVDVSPPYLRRPMASMPNMVAIKPNQPATQKQNKTLNAIDLICQFDRSLSLLPSAAAQCRTYFPMRLISAPCS